MQRKYPYIIDGDVRDADGRFTQVEIDGKGWAEWLQSVIDRKCENKEEEPDGFICSSFEYIKTINGTRRVIRVSYHEAEKRWVARSNSFFGMMGGTDNINQKNLDGNVTFGDVLE